MPARNARLDEYVGGARPAYPVEARLGAHGEWKTTGIDFSDYGRMSRMQQKLDSGRYLATPAWVLNDSQLRTVLVHYLEDRANVNPAPQLSEIERIRRAEKALQAVIPRNEAVLTRLAKEYVALKRDGGDVRMLARLIEGLDTVLVVTKDIASKALMVAHLYYRMGLNSVEVAKEVGIKPPHCRAMLWRLRKVAAALGYGTAPRRERKRPRANVKCKPAPLGSESRQEIVSSPEFIDLFEKARLRLRDPKRKACKHGHEICPANAHVGDMRRLGQYCCNECQRAYNLRSYSKATARS
jgi:hypothetical protein